MLMSPPPALAPQPASAAFTARHLGITAEDEARMCAAIGVASRQALIEQTVPPDIRRTTPMDLPPALSEADALEELRHIARRNQVLRSFIGQGYYGTHTPTVLLRNILENPAWYTAYTPYQAEISQGRMEALLNFQTMVADLTALDIANASLLDEATAAAEAMALAWRTGPQGSTIFLALADTHPQILEVLRTRAAPMGWEVRELPSPQALTEAVQDGCFGALLPYPTSTGAVPDWREAAAALKAQQAAAIACTDLLALTLLKPPGQWGADIAVGSTQRLGLPMGAGGPHAAFMACRQTLQRALPGRLIGVSVDAHGQPAYRLALQTREQHIRREKATSNVCTAQVLPAVMASMYAVWHGPDGLTEIARRVARLTATLAQGLRQIGVTCVHDSAFDTLCLHTGAATQALLQRAEQRGMNLRRVDAAHLSIALDETTTEKDVQALWAVFAADGQPLPDRSELADRDLLPAHLRRTSAFLTHPVFHRHRSETAMLRYLRRLADRDLALDRTMIALGSCTMKLNATSEMIPVTWPEFAHIHPFAPAHQQQGYADLNAQLCQWLAEITGYAGVSLQPNAGSQGEYAGLLAIRAWHAARGEPQRTVCLIPSSAHGTNPASAQMAGMQVVVVACDAQGNVDLDDLRARCAQHRDRLACVMITYPSTHGVFEAGVRELCEVVHAHGGKVYIDGANMNALVGLAAPGAFGGDVSHLNLHKTFCIPHGGGGPGVGPLCVGPDLVPYLPAHASAGQPGTVGAVSAAPLGNASVLPISWMYIRMMGPQGLRHASEVAILSANYLRARLAPHYPTLYTGTHGQVAHECILDLRGFKERCGITAEDVAKRLIDYGFHAPTLSFPVPNTLMVEPTESEPLEELDRFVEAMIAIRQEIAQVEAGHWPREDHPLRHAPHTAASLLTQDWTHPYPREQAAFPLPALRQAKYWPPVGRVDNVHGDRHLFCTCPPLSDEG